MITAIYPGTFDPLTNGHFDIIVRGCKIFSRLIVAVAENPSKRPHFTLETRIRLAQKACSDFQQVEVLGFSGLLIDFAREQGVGVILRGLRAVSDYEYELQLAELNRQLAPELETVFLTPAQQFGFLSSSLVRELARLGGNIEHFVPKAVLAEIQTQKT